MSPHKSFKTVVLEGACYIVIAACGPFAELLISDRDTTARAVTAATVLAFAAAANALKAFLSQSIGPNKEEPMEVVAPPGRPIETKETNPADKHYPPPPYE